MSKSNLEEIEIRKALFARQVSAEQSTPLAALHLHNSEHTKETEADNAYRLY